MSSTSKGGTPSKARAQEIKQQTRKYPRIHLAIDNTFAVKRWVAPAEWARRVADLGMTCVEASTDVECDPFYLGRAALQDWVAEVKTAEEQFGTRVVNLFTGWSTYRTVGLVHSDERVRRNLLNNWFRPMVETAGQLGAGLGFYLHAFPQAVFRSPVEFERIETLLLEGIAETLQYANECGAGPIVIEQMYAPHQTPWTVEGAKKYLRSLFEEAGLGLYIAIDTGHQVGQRRFLRPTRQRLAKLLSDGYTADVLRETWLGPEEVYDRLLEIESAPKSRRVAALDELTSIIERYEYLFATEQDGNLYYWLEKLGAWSPVIHLQQTDGRASAHLPFTRNTNVHGIVNCDSVVTALARSFEQELDPALPPPVEDIYLTFEIFSSPLDYGREIMDRLQQSIDYWRRFIPQDGLHLDALIALQKQQRLEDGDAGVDIRRRGQD